MNNEELACLWLNHMKTFNIRDFYKMIEALGGIEETYEMLSSGEEVLEKLVEARMIKAQTKQEILELNKDYWLECLMDDLERTGIRYVTYFDEKYPDRLKDISDYPLVLFYRGHLEYTEAEYAIGIVGSRRPSFYGLNTAEEFASELARKKIVVISGMAYGIDSKAHQATMKANGKTIAVLGGGVDICYPTVNFDIYQEMCENHLVISEYAPGSPHVSKNFPTRNRIISGLSDGILVVEAALRSGTLITADFALNQGKQIYAVPGRTSDILSKGSNNLIKQGAVLTDSPVDIMTDMYGTEIVQKKRKSTKTKKRKSEKNVKNLTGIQKKLFGMLGYEPIYIDDLIRANDMKICETIQEMNELCRQGFAECIEKCYYILKI